MTNPLEDPVAQHYRAYPYPLRDPADEKTRLILGSPSHLDEVTHYIFKGRLPARRLRILVAGGGTGDGLVMLAQQCAERNISVDITYLDLSPASREIAEARIAQRHLNNVTFVTGSLLDAASLAPGPYDYIDCCGVLHHLDDPAAGLEALAHVIEPQGGMGIMVYAPYGRSGVYPMQSALRRLAPLGLMPEAERVLKARRLTEDLPHSNLLRRNPLVRDHIDGGDAGIYDLLLHARDRAFTVTELERFVTDAALGIISFIDPARYNPTHYLSDPGLRRRAAELPSLDQAALAEELSSAMKVHIAYIGKPGSTLPQLEPSAILVPRDNMTLADTVRKNHMVEVDGAGTSLRYALPRLAQPILKRIDGRKTCDEIYSAMAADDPTLGRDLFDRQMTEIYNAYNALGLLHIRFG